MPSVAHPVPLVPPPLPFNRAYHSINTRIDQIGNNQRDALLTWLLSVANIVPEGCIAAFAINQKSFCAIEQSRVSPHYQCKELHTAPALQRHLLPKGVTAAQNHR